MIEKKVLICEDTEILAKMIADYFRELDVHIKPVVLAHEGKADLVVDETEATVRREQPDYMVVDGLGGRWEKVINIARKVKPDIKAVVFSGDYGMVDEARQRGYKVFEKPGDNDRIVEYFVGLAKAKP